MPIDFYQLNGSAPCRSVALTASMLGLEMNFIELNLMNGDHLKPEFVKVNPQHTIPTIVDNGFSLWESRAIMTYLANKYGKDDSLYPKNPQKRAIVDQRLYFDMGTMYDSFSNYYYPMLFAGAEPDKTKYEKIGKAFEFLDMFLDGHNYVAGDHLTLADLSLVATVSTIEGVNYDFSEYKNVTRWLAKMKTEIPNYQKLNQDGVEVFKGYIDSLKKK